MITSAYGSIIVNTKTARIFNGLFETWNQAKNTENFAKMREKNACVPPIYHAGIKHDGCLLLLRHKLRISAIRPCATGAAIQASGYGDGDAFTHGGNRVRHVALGAEGESPWVCN
jgi:hypothetical protein